MNNNNHLLYKDILDSIFMNLEIKDISSLSMVCKKFNETIDNNFVDRWANKNGPQNVLAEHNLINVITNLSLSDKWSNIKMQLNVDNRDIFQQYIKKNNLSINDFNNIIL
jgi:hypothetical protein